MLALVLSNRALGGKGSGNFGHAGRPGLVGGSSDEPGNVSQDDSPAGLPQGAETESGAHAIGRSTLYKMAATGKLTFYHESPGDIADSVKREGIRSDYGVFAAINTPSNYVDAEVKTVIEFQLPKKEARNNVSPDMIYEWGNLGAWQMLLKSSRTDLRGAYVSVNLDRIPPSYIKSVRVVNKRVLGGKGSGNFGHAGRPGLVGGSGLGGIVVPFGDRWLTFQTKTGSLEAQRTDDNLQVRESFVKVDARGTGEGQRLYRSLFEYAETQGLTVTSSHAVSADADRVWAALVRKGYPAERSEHVELDESLNKFYVVRPFTVAGTTVMFRTGDPVWRYDPSKSKRALAELGSTPLHTAADRHVKSLAVAVRYAFAVARKKVDWMRALGGPGSGNFGHAGRPGLVGGSGPEGVVDTPAFKAWFGDSKIVDAHGNPQRVFHGAKESDENLEAFTQFQGIDLWSREDHPTWLTVIGDWFTEDPKVADYFARGPDGHVYPVYLSIKNPFVVRRYEDAEGEVEESGLSVQEWRQSLIDRGYDGLIIERSVTDVDIVRKDFVPFSSTQVKSAIGNRGTFDPKSRFITMGASAFNPDPILSTLSRELTKVLPGALTRCAVEGAGVGVDSLSSLRSAEEFRAAKKSVQFNAINKRAAAWARKHAAEMIVDITETSRKRIKAAIANLLEGESYRSILDKIAKAVGDDDHAMLIARHETMSAVSAGQREAWAQAVEDDLLDGGVRRVWIATPIGACPVCEKLDGKMAKIGGTYPGGSLGPPEHVACRCTEGLQ